MILAAYMVGGFLVASIYAVGMLRGPARPPAPPRAADPADDRADRDPGPALRRRHRGARGRRPPAGQVRRHGVHPGDRHAPDRVPRRDLHRRRGQGRRSGSPTSTPSWSASAPTPRSTGLQRHPGRRTAAGQHPAPPRLRRDGRDRLGAAAARRLARLGLVETARHPADAVVPARGRGLRRRRDRRALVRLDRHRGRPPAVDRPGLHADLRSGHRGEGDLVRVRPASSCSTRRSGRSRSSSCAAMSRRWREEGDGRRRRRPRTAPPSRPEAAGREQGRRRRGDPLDRRDPLRASSAAPTSAPASGT